MSPADALAQKIAPALVAALAAKEETIIAESGGLMTRWVVRAVFPVILDEIPPLADVAINVIATEFGSLTINDFIAIFSGRAKELQGKA